MAILPAALLLGIEPASGDDRSCRRFPAPLAVQVEAIEARSCPPSSAETASCCLVATLNVLSTRNDRLGLRRAEVVVSPGLLSGLVRDFGDFWPVAARQLAEELRDRSRAAGEGPPHNAEVEPAAAAVTAELFDALPYRVLPHVVMPQPVEHRLAILAARFRRVTGRRLVVTSGTRTPESQAAAMLVKLRRRRRFLRLYRKRELAREVYRSYRAGVRRRETRGELKARVAQVLRDQIRRGEHLSAHLREGAVDLRSRDLRRRHKRVLRRLTADMWGMRLINEERHPPHFHLEVATSR